MTRFTVVWVQGARDDLTEAWLVASDRNAVTTATTRIDAALAVDPHRQGFELAEGLRALFAPPLKVIYAVREDDRIVEVLRVRSL